MPAEPCLGNTGFKKQGVVILMLSCDISVVTKSQIYVLKQSNTTPLLINVFTATCFGSNYEHHQAF